MNLNKYMSAKSKRPPNLGEDDLGSDDDDYDAILNPQTTVDKLSADEPAKQAPMKKKKSTKKNLVCILIVTLFF